MGVVLDVNERDQYLIGTRSGQLPHRYGRNELVPSQNSFILPEEVPENVVGFREAVGAESVTGIQG